MAIARRTFLAGAVSAFSLSALAACTPDSPVPPTPTLTPTELPPGPVPNPSAFFRSAWADDPFSLGSFSSMPVGATPASRTTLRETVGARLFFAGEATSSEFPGTVVGAAASGESVAERVAAVAQPEERIGIVGAGLAGATAARLLKEQGFDVVVIEARDRVGGRIDTREADGWPFPVELGAASVSAEGLAELLRLNDIDTLSLESDAETRTASGLVVPPSSVGPDAVAQAVAWSKQQGSDASLASALSASGADAVSAEPGASGVSPADELVHYLDTAVASRYGASPFELSASYGLDREGQGGGGAGGAGLAEGTRLIVGGLDTVVSTSLEDVDVLLSSTVIRISHTDDGASLRLGTGESLSVDRVIVTVPIGVLQAGTIEFAPELPESTTSAIEELGMGSLEQLWLRFDEPFWSTEATVLSVVDETSEIAEWINLMPATGQAILIGLTAADDVAVALKQNDQEFLEAALQTLVPFVDPEATSTPSPTTRPTVGAG
ncbi:FAD-dependent oxidoreductase [Herbiconiux sp. P15]|uniref:flavin monoamine oxidase family protein n=1 Tax=Herbiconiux liukaitaii TaxID=3342799 RepID=UPI0035B7C73A